MTSLTKQEVRDLQSRLAEYGYTVQDVIQSHTAHTYSRKVELFWLFVNVAIFTVGAYFTLIHLFGG